MRNGGCSRACARARGRRAFTLIEILVVIVILTILMSVLVVNLGSVFTSTEAKATSMDLTKIGGMIAEHEDEQGDFPRSSFAADLGPPPNAINVGSECLYLALCAEGAPGFGLLDDLLGNTDEDQLAKRVKGFETLALYELADRWGNPIAYFNHRDYAREDVYVTYSQETGERLEAPVRALKNAKTNRYFEPTRFQLISAGPDGAFGTEDDVTSFAR
jgi:prepilin-type N-terminal cleavage/methylation domain-containing protein